MKAMTMLDTLSSVLGTPVGAIPLSSCRPARRYLLDRAGIGEGGTALLFCIPYVMIRDVDEPDRNLSLYAVPRDYHAYVRALDAALIPHMTESFPGHRFALFADHSPIREVDAAARAGLGVRGENGLLLTPQYGSFVFIASLITDAGYAEATGGTDGDGTNIPDEAPSCEGCGACHRACPAGGDCLSALTQKKEAFADDEAERLLGHALVWGCDTCQLVCPHNRRVIAAGTDTPIPYFREARLSRLSTAVLDAMDDAAFSERAYAWRGRAVIRRNLALRETNDAKEEES